MDLHHFPYDTQVLEISIKYAFSKLTYSRIRSIAWPAEECELINITPVALSIMESCNDAFVQVDELKKMTKRIDLVDWEVATPVTCEEVRSFLVRDPVCPAETDSVRARLKYGSVRLGNARRYAPQIKVLPYQGALSSCLRCAQLCGRFFPS